MIIYDGTYRLKSPDGEPFSFDRMGEQAWWVRIVRFCADRPGPLLLKPWAIFATPSSPGEYRIAAARGIGAELLGDFSLDPRRVLWVEYFKTDPGHLHVARFSSGPSTGAATFDTIHWRPIRPAELARIRRFIPEAEFIDIPH
jgi:hypothetical protein